jgi:hypothetical protein
MPTLYYTPTSCGAASFITAHTAQLDNVDVETVELSTHKTAGGQARARTHSARVRCARASERCRARACEERYKTTTEA